MQIEAQKLIGLSVASMETLSKAGEIKQIVVDPMGGQILGFLVQLEGFFAPTLALSIIDISEWDLNGIVTQTEENLVPVNEIVRINDIVKNNIFLIGMKAKTETGKNLGEIENFLIDTDLQIVVKYYLRDLFGQARIFPAEKVIKIEQNTIIFTDDVTDISGRIIETQVV